MSDILNYVVLNYNCIITDGYIKLPIKITNCNVSDIINSISNNLNSIYGKSGNLNEIINKITIDVDLLFYFDIDLFLMQFTGTSPKYEKFLKKIKSSQLFYDTKDSFKIKELSHGMSGGNCYGDESTRFNENLEIDSIINNKIKDVNKLFKTNIGELKYNVSYETNDEYYGNFSTYLIIEFDKLYLFNKCKDVL